MIEFKLNAGGDRRKRPELTGAIGQRRTQEEEKEEEEEEEEECKSHIYPEGTHVPLVNLH